MRGPRKLGFTNLGKLPQRLSESSKSPVKQAAALFVFVMLLTPALALILTTRGGVVVASPGWTTPTDVTDACTAKDTEYTIDEDTGTYWQHDATCYHWIIFDFGASYTVTKIRLYQVEQEEWGGMDGVSVYVSENTTDWGSAVWSGTMLDGTGWKESGSFSKSGRYIKLVTLAGYSWERMYEFQAYVQIPPIYPTQPIPYLPSNDSTVNDHTPYFEWTKGENATSHRLLVDNDNDFSSPEENRSLTDNFYTIANENNLPEDNYFWKVGAINENGENWSATWTFIVTNWVTPISVEYVSGQSAGTENIYTIDDNTSSYWHWSYEGSTKEIWFKMDESYLIKKIRLYQATSPWGLSSGLTVYVSDNTQSWGDNVWEGVLNSLDQWNETSEFNARGQYIRLLSKTTVYTQRMYEFDAYLGREWQLIETWTGLIDSCPTPSITTDAATDVGADNAMLNATIELGPFSQVEVKFDYKSDYQCYIESENENWFISDHYYDAPVDPATTGNWANRTPVKTVAAVDSDEHGSADYNCDGAYDDAQIESAIAAVDPGGAVYLYDGHYVVESILCFADNISVIGESKENTIVTSSQVYGGQSALYLRGENLLVENITFVGTGRTHATETKGIFAGMLQNTVVNNVIVRDVSVIGIYYETSGMMEGNWIINSEVRNCGHGGIILAKHYEQWGGGPQRYLENNYILNNTLVGVAMGGPNYGGDSGIALYSVKHTVVANNTIENCGRKAIAAVGGGYHVQNSSENILIQANSIRRCNLLNLEEPAINVSGTVNVDENEYNAIDIVMRGNKIKQFSGFRFGPLTENCTVDNNSVYNTVYPFIEFGGSGHIVENNTDVLWENFTPWENVSTSDYSKDIEVIPVTLYACYATIKYDSVENEGNWVTFQTIGIGKPQLYLPENNASISGVIANFEWTPGAGCAYSRLVVNDDIDFTGDNTVDLNFNCPENTHAESLDGIDYWWKVIAVYGVSENESDVWTFTINIPPSVENLHITGTDNVATDNLVPQTQYKFWVEVEDNETLADIENVTLVVYLDNENLPDNTTNHYTFRWTKAGGFEEVGPGGYAGGTGIVIDDDIGQTTNAWAGARIPSQHKAFHVVGRFWQFYNNADTEELLKSTSIDGETWSSPTSLGDVDYGAYFSVCLDDEENFHFAKQYPYSSGPLTYRKGTPLENGDISWIAGWQTVVSGSEIRSDPHITVDANGYPWVGYGADDYDGHVVKSDNKDGTWETSSGFPYDLDNRGTSLRPQMAIPSPLSNGQVYVVYGWWSSAAPSGENQLHGKLWNNSNFEDEENVSTSLPFGYPSMWSTLGMGNDVHVAMFTKDNDIVYIKRTWGSGWGSEENVETDLWLYDYSTPTLLSDEGDNAIWVFWGEDTNHIDYRKKVDGAWENKVDWIDESADKFYLKRGYTVCSASKPYDNKVLVYYVTETNDTTPYQLKFAYIDLGAFEHLIIENCENFDDTLTVDNIIFAIEFGEDATVTDADNWDVWVQVHDSAGNEDNRFFLNRFDIITPYEWELVETWTGTIEGHAEWQSVESWTGTVQTLAAWQSIETWTGTIEAVAQWGVAETWTGTIQSPSAWNLIETWTGTIEAPAQWSSVEEWSGTVQAPTAWVVMESWSGTIQAPTAWSSIETWTGTVEAPSAWNIVETWTGTVQTLAEWQLIETWDGTVQAPVGWSIVETWTGSVSAPAEWNVVETWTGTVQTPSRWDVIEAWTGTIQTLAEWVIIESWGGTLQTVAEWLSVETWTGTIEAPAEWQLKETWTGTLETFAEWELIETWAGTLHHLLAEVTTESATDVGMTIATLNALVDHGSYENVDIRFQYRALGIGVWTNTAWENDYTATLYSKTVEGLSSGTTYQFRGHIEFGSFENFGSIVEFTTQSEAPPTEQWYLRETWTGTIQTEDVVRWRSVESWDGTIMTVAPEEEVTPSPGPRPTPPEEEEEAPPVTIPLSITGVWIILLAVCATWIWSLPVGPRKRRWAEDIARWILPTAAGLTLVFIWSQKVVLSPVTKVVGAWGVIFAIVIFFLSSVEAGPRRMRWAKQFLAFVVPTLIILTWAYLRISGVA